MVLFLVYKDAWKNWGEPHPGSFQRLLAQPEFKVHQRYMYQSALNPCGSSGWSSPRPLHSPAKLAASPKQIMPVKA
jgi:hypothetical protein